MSLQNANHSISRVQKSLSWAKINLFCFSILGRLEGELDWVAQITGTYDCGWNPTRRTHLLTHIHVCMKSHVVHVAHQSEVPAVTWACVSEVSVSTVVCQKPYLSSLAAEHFFFTLQMRDKVSLRFISKSTHEKQTRRQVEGYYINTISPSPVSSWRLTEAWTLVVWMQQVWCINVFGNEE